MFLSWKTTSRPVVLAGLALALAVGAGLGCRARAQAPAGSGAAKPDDPTARALLEEVSKAYQSLSSYSDQGQFTIAMTIGGKTRKESRPLKLTLVRPSKLDLDAGVVRMTSDGTTLTTAVFPLKRYTAAPAPAKIGMDTFREGPMGAMLFGGAPAPAMYVLLNLLTAADPPAAIKQLGGSLRVAPAPPHVPKRYAGLESQALLIDLDRLPDIVLTVDPATKLLSRIEMKVDPQQVATKIAPGQTLTIEQFVWTSGAVSTQVGKDRSFAFEPPKDFAKVDSFLPDRRGGEARFAVDEKVGKPSPDFTLTILDGPDKTRTITKAELSGKVVVLDFWATWCGPCLEELPEIQKLIMSYAESKKDVVVVALSQDNNPAELSEVRKLVEKTLSVHNLTLASSPVGFVGLDPSNTVSQAFNIEGFPTLVILDAKGVVQAVHVGVDPHAGEPIHKSLAREINTLLAGKPLAGSAKKAEGAPEKNP